MVSPLLAAPDKFEVKCSEQAITAPTAHLDLHLLISAQTFQVLLSHTLRSHHSTPCTATPTPSSRSGQDAAPLATAGRLGGLVVLIRFNVPDL